jgi:hypothetical protein
MHSATAELLDRATSTFEMTYGRGELLGQRVTQLFEPQDAASDRTCKGASYFNPQDPLPIPAEFR